MSKTEKLRAKSFHKCQKSGNTGFLFLFKVSANLLLKRISGHVRLIRKHGKRRKSMEKIKIITHGIATPEGLSDNEKRAFYVAMLVRILDSYQKDQSGKGAK